MMESDYAYDRPECDMKPLETIANIAEEAERAGTLISAFITRFRHGSLPEPNSGRDGIKPVPSGHAGQLTRLRDAVATVEKLARDLGTLG
jgi:hypothetical protein